MPRSKYASNTAPHSAREDVSSRHAQWKIHQGALTLFVAQKPVVPLFVGVTETTSEAEISACSETGSSLYWLHNSPLGWQSPGKYDYEVLDRRVKSLLAGDKSARFFLSVSLNPPDWWLETHPMELAAYCLPGEEDSQVKTVSWASKRWRSEAGEALILLARYVSRQEWGQRCLGYHLSAGENGDWTYPDPERLPDISTRMTEQFLAFALDKYRRNGGLLRKAWFDTRADFDRITCPAARERGGAEMGIFRSPRRSQRLLDYYECLAKTRNSAALHFCGLVKKATEGRALVGLTYGLVRNTGFQAERGVGFPEEVFDSPDVDLFVNPGGRAETPNALTGSLALREKFLLVENTVPAQSKGSFASALAAQAGVILPAGTPPEVLKGAQRLGETALRLPAKSRQRPAQLAVVLDPAAGLYTTRKELLTTTLQASLDELDRAGIPFALYMPADLFHPKFPDHKVTVFLNTFFLSEAERRRLDARVKRSEQTAVWLWGSGIVGEEGINADLGQRCCGQKIRLEAGEISLRVRIAESNDPLTWGQHVGQTFGEETSLSPILTVADKTATRLGANTSNKTVFSVLRLKTWTSVVFGTPSVPASLLRNVFRAAGCHLYTEDGAVISADGRFLALQSDRKAIKVSLPGVYDVLDAWTGQAAANHVTELSVPSGCYELKPMPVVEDRKSRRHEE